MDSTSHRSHEMNDREPWANSPLTFEELALIDGTALSSFDRHHVRLLAHCLACFKEMAQEVSVGPLPSEQKRMKWCLDQPSLINEKAFISILLEQFALAARQLEEFAVVCDVSPLELKLEDLIAIKIDASESGS